MHLALEARKRLAQKGFEVRVVSMPSWELFDKAPLDYQDKVLPLDVTARLSVEAGISMGWERYVGSRTAIIAIDRFGASAPGTTVMEKYGLTEDQVVSKAMQQLKSSQG